MDDEERVVRFQFADAFSPNRPIADWILSLSMALNDMRTAADFAVRPEQPAHEQLYFVRLLASHMREVVKLVLLAPEEREEVRVFIASMAAEGQQALDDIQTHIDAHFELRPNVTLFDEIKRLRDDTFHYARDQDSRDRLAEAMRRAGPSEGTYRVTDRALRAEYADTARMWLVHPFDGSDEENEALARELHAAIMELIKPLSDFLHHAEAHYLHNLPEGTVDWG